MKTLLLSFGIMLCYLSVYSQSIFEEFPSTGEIEVTLHPGATITPGSTHLVSFGVPFPRNTVTSISQILVTDDQGNELASDVKEITRWHSLSGNSNINSLRSALFYVNIQFNTVTTKTIKIVYGSTRTLELGTQGDVKDSWVSTELEGVADEYPNNAELIEPAVYATLPVSWLDTSVLRTRVVPKDEVSPEYQWYEDAKINFGNTMVDDVADTVALERVNVEIFSQWLFDRALTLWNIYISTGELKWLRAAHKASQYYAKELHPEGYFIPKFEDNGQKDLKYSYGGSMLIDMMLTGDTSLLTKIEQVASFAAQPGNSQVLNNDSGFWTERHYAYWLLASLSAFEATGNEQYLVQTNDRIAHLFFRAKNPINGWTAEGGILHTKNQHQEFDPGGTEPIISPWMSALLSEAVWRYYLHSEDEEALEFLIGLADNVVNSCLYEPETLDEGTPVSDMYIPYYLASGQLDPIYYGSAGNGDFKEEGNVEHTKDVLGLIARGIWARKKLSLTIPEATSEKISKMINAALFDIDLWTRTAPDRPRYRLRPFRKYNWWFGTTSDLEWLMTNNPTDVLGVDEFEENNIPRFSIYPNPTENILYVNPIGRNKILNITLNLYDLSGKKLNSFEIENVTLKNSLDFSYLSSGIYFIKIVSDTHKETLKFIKK